MSEKSSSKINKIPIKIVNWLNKGHCALLTLGGAHRSKQTSGRTNKPSVYTHLFLWGVSSWSNVVNSPNYCQSYLFANFKYIFETFGSWELIYKQNVKENIRYYSSMLE